MNEWTHFFINIYLSHFILERVDVGCVWKKSWRQGQEVLLSTIAFLPHLGLVAQPWVTEDQKPSVCRWFSIRHLVTNWFQLTQTLCAPGYIIVLHPPASAVHPHIYAGASLDWRLSRGSIYKSYVKSKSLYPIYQPFRSGRIWHKVNF